jgi:hypothetical protein
VPGRPGAAATIYAAAHENHGWLVHLCFLNDPTHQSDRFRSTREQWSVAFKEADAHLGLGRPVPNYAHVFLDGVPRPTSEQLHR